MSDNVDNWRGSFIGKKKLIGSLYSKNIEFNYARLMLLSMKYRYYS